MCRNDRSTDALPDKLIYPRIAEIKPLVQCITNSVTAGSCANALLAVGASPTMAHAAREAAEVAAGCDALVCNLGATADFKAMRRACAVNRRMRHPVVLDPVGAGGSGLRRQFAGKLLKRGGITCVRGNVSEIRALVQEHSTVTGVDALEDVSLEDRIMLAGELAARYGILVVLSGEKDVVTDGTEYFLIANGSAFMTRVTGCGCMASALLGAYLATVRKLGGILGESQQETGKSLKTSYNPDLMAAAELMSSFGICGELAQERTETAGGGTMTFYYNLMDGLSGLNENIIRKRENIKKLK